MENPLKFLHAPHLTESIYPLGSIYPYRVSLIQRRSNPILKI